MEKTKHYTFFKIMPQKDPLMLFQASSIYPNFARRMLKSLARSERGKYFYTEYIGILPPSEDVAIEEFRFTP